jgi:hypothetical protein
VSDVDVVDFADGLPRWAGIDFHQNRLLHLIVNKINASDQCSNGPRGIQCQTDFIDGGFVRTAFRSLTDIRDPVTWAATMHTEDFGANDKQAQVAEDHHGRVWTAMTLYRFETADRVDRGRRVSVGYVALFRQFEDDVTP